MSTRSLMNRANHDPHTGRGDEAARTPLSRGALRIQALLDYSPSIIAVKDLDGRYLMSNAETSRILGRPPEDIIGRYCVELFPSVAEQLRINDRRAAATMQPVFDDVELELDGEVRTYLTVTFALPDDHGRAAETCTIATDVTEVREHEGRRRERRTWEGRIGSALREDRLLVYAQPVVHLQSGTADWRELLARLDPPEPGSALMLPDEFLPPAERWELVQSIDIHMVEHAIALHDGAGAHVNLSAITLCDPAARAAILERVRAAPASGERLVFEITETAAAGHLRAAARFAAELAELGCGIGLDDFGTGFGSFTYLRRLPLRFVKIDASFVQGITRHPADRRVVASIIGVAREFGLSTVAEGVEDEATLDVLNQLGADYAQGFLLGAPEPVAARSLAR